MQLPRTMIRRWRAALDRGGDPGFTLVELLVSVAILGFVLAVVFLMLNSVQSMADRLNANAVATDEARHAVDVMTRELRMAQVPDPPSNGTAAPANMQNSLFTGSIQDQKLSFWADVDRDGTAELVTYKMSGNSLVRTVTELASETTLGSEGPAQVLVANFPASVRATDPIFRYWDENGNRIATGGGSGSIDPNVYTVVAVELDVTAASTGQFSSGAQVSSTIDNLVRLRSARTSLGF